MLNSQKAVLLQEKIKEMDRISKDGDSIFLKLNNLLTQFLALKSEVDVCVADGTFDPSDLDVAGLIEDLAVYPTAVREKYNSADAVVSSIEG